MTLNSFFLNNNYLNLTSWFYISLFIIILILNISIYFNYNVIKTFIDLIKKVWIILITGVVSSSTKSIIDKQLNDEDKNKKSNKSEKSNNKLNSSCESK